MRTLLAVGAVLVVAGCSGMNDTEKSAATGTVVGAGGGAIIGAMAGNAGMGAAIGAGVGLIGGLVVDKVQKDKKKAYDDGFSAGKAEGQPAKAQ
jgi:osmotically inducible lipoprotein OsmB